MFLVGIVLMIIGLIISVALHELGHLVPAKKFGAIVPDYWIGFGPVLFSKKVRGTTYGLRAVLLGGYVRIVGMFPPLTVAVSGRRPDRGMVADARQQSGEEIAAALQSGSPGTPFYRLRTAQKLTVMLGGPLMNLLLAFALTLISVVGFGWQQATTTISEVLPTTGEPGTALEERPSPAAAAGVQAGDIVIAWNGIPIESWSEFTQLLDRSGIEESVLTIARGGVEQDLVITPVESEAGPKVGVVSQVERVRGTVGDAASVTWQMAAGTGQALIHLPQSLWNLVVGIGNGEPRDPEGVVSILGVARLAGEVATTDGANVTLADRVGVLLSLLASLNMALFVFNLIPLPPLDGGHVAGALWGGVRNTWARVLGKPKPLPVDTAKMVPVSYAVFWLLIGMSLILMAADIFKPLQWG